MILLRRRSKETENVRSPKTFHRVPLEHVTRSRVNKKYYIMIFFCFHN